MPHPPPPPPLAQLRIARGRDTVVSASENEQESREPTVNLKQFVGREAEMQRMIRLLEATMENGPHLVTVIGEAGVGKSTLVRRLVSEVRLRAGSLVTAAVSKPMQSLRTRRGPKSSLEFIRWASSPRSDGVSFRVSSRALGSGAHEPSGNKYTLFDEIVRYLRLAAAARPIVIVLDDMQWSDSATWDVLEHVMAQLEQERMLICLTMRSEETRGEASSGATASCATSAITRSRSRVSRRQKSNSGSPASLAAMRVASCSRTCNATPRAIRCSPRSSFACCSTTAPCASSTVVGRCVRSVNASFRRRSRD